MNIDRIETQGEDNPVDELVLLQAVAKAGWDKIWATNNRRPGLKYSIGLGIRAGAHEVIPTLEKLFAKMADDRIVNNVTVDTGKASYHINMVDYLKAHVFDGDTHIPLVTKKETPTTDIGSVPALGEGNDQGVLEILAREYRQSPPPQSIRGKSNIMQSMTLMALHQAFGQETGRPTAQRAYLGNNAATTILGNIGRRKPRGK